MAGVSIDSFCRPSSSPQAIAAGCTGKDGAALTDSSTACGMCSGGFFLFRGGCYKAGVAPGSEICTKAEGGKCTACNAANGLFQNPAASPTPGSECILCWDTVGADKYTGVENCQTCTAPGSAGAATCSACQEGYYLDNADKTCKPCTGCATCDTSATQCTSCPEGKYLKGNTCAENCGGNTYYPDPVSGKCISCGAQEGGIESCATCEYDSTKGKPKCLTCTDASTKTPKTSLDGTSTCVAKTLDGCQGIDKELFVKQDQTCALCSDDSVTDAGSKGTANCKTCQKTADGTNPTCSACLDGYFFTASSSTCATKCDQSCSTCSEAVNANKCESCYPGYFLVTEGADKKCIPCGDTAKDGIDGCAECSGTAGSLKCTNCRANYRRQPNGGASDDYTCTKVCEDPTACGGTAGSCGAIVVGGDGSMKYYCSQCRQQ
ncbi:Variant-specific surface protein [Giardia duodenalis]|uniref:Variant-specific surface protein n=1 Tax=Giardia intestinalis TaxID=5741 RepID=V6U181_GIAIN|nr:Variant-specific surface protein [Giardia intestinalis]